ncbi:ATP-binding protein [Kitasatospora xanthocidica]|uniref:ATP-binding protein n=1 Tax=Kitasatospora xanthocidica TaxID=83382 RepID=UPI0036E9B9E0
MSTAPAPAPAVEKPSVVHLPYQPDSASAARRLVREKLTAWGLEALLDDAVLIVSELVTNAVKTGCRRRMTVRIDRIDTASVRISVTDGSRVPPVLLEAGEDDECHRGLALVNRLTRGQWGIAIEALGKTVHADLRAGAT